MNTETRWKQRFANFHNAYKVFLRRYDEYQQNTDKEVYQMALVQAFEMTLELAWKTLKDYLEHQGFIDITSGKQAIRQAFQAKVIHQAEVWMAALEIRNESSHTYNAQVLDKVIQFIADKFYPVLCELHQRLEDEL